MIKHPYGIANSHIYVFRIQPLYISLNYEKHALVQYFTYHLWHGKGFGPAVIYLLFIVALIVCGDFVLLGPCFIMQYFVSFLGSLSSQLG